MAGLVERGLRTLCFAKSRKAAELVHRFTAERLDGELAERLSPYRAGYTPAQRREIERRLVEGELLGVAATDALELGIDVGLLDAVISVGFPGTVACAAPAVGPRRPPRPRARRARRERGRARPVLHARARDAARPPRGGGDPRPREPARARRPRARGRVRGAARRARRRRSSAPSALERAAAAAGAASRRRPARLGRHGLPGRALSLCARPTPDAFTVVDEDDRRGARRSSSASARTRPCTTAPIYLHLGESYLVRRARPRRARGARRAVPRRLVHAGEEGDDDRDRRGAARTSACSGSTLVLRRVDRHRAGRRATSGRRSATGRRSTSMPLDLPPTAFDDRGALVRARAGPARTGSSRCRGCSARCTRPSTR